MKVPLSLVAFLALVAGGGLLIGALTSPDVWYEALTKPSFMPPPWLFGPVWGVLYVLIAIAGWRIWLRDRAGRPMMLWWAQLILNFAWSPLFFSLHQIGVALVVIIVLLVVILAFIVAALRCDRVAALLFVPYAAWVIFAMALNIGFLALNWERRFGEIAPGLSEAGISTIFLSPPMFTDGGMMFAARNL